MGSMLALDKSTIWRWILRAGRLRARAWSSNKLLDGPLYNKHCSVLNWLHRLHCQPFFLKRSHSATWDWC